MKKKLNIQVLMCFITVMLLLNGCSNTDENIVLDEEQSKSEEVLTTEDSLERNKLIEVDGGNQSGHREPNVVVDIGYGDREYYAYTNEHSQLVKVTANKITLQNESTEPVLSTGRYYSDEAKVPGVESPTLDEGHVIADSLGGVSNSYNITPQESTLNRHGDQAYMEKVIRNAGGCTDFIAVITYPNINTQIPSHYSYKYTINGNVVYDEFDNVNPDKVNAKLETNVSHDNQTNTMNKKVMITDLDKKVEYIIITNSGSKSVDLTGWKILSVIGNQSFTFPKFTLNSNSSVKVGDSAKNSDVKFHWLDGKGTWHNRKSDPAELYNTKGELVDRFDN
ncbi:MAG: lamin tail domain-containing protein [Tepidibacter sp.]|uniref:lamin tail domain-containing protein n=1 Tax=Tepidibacter sp. TaxID=2529387 RepID=UPI0025CDAFB7|nr:lamin tail domain-containing protein [Tepidibacter sp.]MCT4510001.1 lamin tail domain-containing protein [Tepidibacter sp.]